MDDVVQSHNVGVAQLLQQARLSTVIMRRKLVKRVNDEKKIEDKREQDLLY